MTAAVSQYSGLLDGYPGAAVGGVNGKEFRIIQGLGQVFGDNDISVAVNPDDRRPVSKYVNSDYFEDLVASRVSKLIRDFVERLDGWWPVAFPISYNPSDKYRVVLKQIRPTLAGPAPPFLAAEVVEMKKSVREGHLVPWQKKWEVETDALEFEDGIEDLALMVNEVGITFVRRMKSRAELAAMTATNVYAAYNALYGRQDGAPTYEEMEAFNNRLCFSGSTNRYSMTEYKMVIQRIAASAGVNASNLVLPNGIFDQDFYKKANADYQRRLVGESAEALNAANTAQSTLINGMNIWQSKRWSEIEEGRMRTDFLTHPKLFARTHLLSAIDAAQHIDHQNFNARAQMSIRVHDMTRDEPVVIDIVRALNECNRFSGETELDPHVQSQADSINYDRSSYTAVFGEPEVVDGRKIWDTLLYTEDTVDWGTPGNPTKRVRVAEILGDLEPAVFSFELQALMMRGLIKAKDNRNLSGVAELLKVEGQEAEPNTPKSSTHMKRIEYAKSLDEEQQKVFNAISLLPLNLKTLTALVEPFKGNTVLPFSVTHFDWLRLDMGDALAFETGAGATYYNSGSTVTHMAADHHVAGGVVRMRLESVAINEAGFIFLLNLFPQGYGGGGTTNVFTKVDGENVRSVDYLMNEMKHGDKSGFFFLHSGNIGRDTAPKTTWLTGRRDPRMFFNLTPKNAHVRGKHLECMAYYSSMFGFHTLNNEVDATPYHYQASQAAQIVAVNGYRGHYRTRDPSTGQYSVDVEGKGPLPAIYKDTMTDVFAGREMIFQSDTQATVI